MALNIINGQFSFRVGKAGDVEMADADEASPVRASSSLSTNSSFTLPTSTAASSIDGAALDEGEITDSKSSSSTTRPILRYSRVFGDRRILRCRNRRRTPESRSRSPTDSLRNIPTSPRAFFHPSLRRPTDTYKGPGPTREIEDLVGGLTMEHNQRHDGYQRRRGGHGGHGGHRHGYGGHRQHWNNNNNNYQGGGDGGNRKRRYQEDDHQERRERPNQRARYEEPLASRLRREIVLIAEKDNVVAFAARIGKTIADNFDGDDQIQGPLLNIMVQLICEQPLKIPHLAAVLLHANDTNGAVLKLMLQKIQPRAQTSLEEGNWQQLKLLLRFLACLQNVFDDGGVFPFLDALFERAVDQQTADVGDVTGLEFVKIILLTLPYAIKSGATDIADKIQSLLQRTEIIASAEHAMESLAEPYLIDNERPFGFQSVLDLLQKQLIREGENGWKFDCLPQTYIKKDEIKPENGDDNMNGVQKSTTLHQFPALTIPSSINPGARSLFPETFFSIYSDQDVGSVPGTHDIASSLIRDVIADTINILDYNRHSVAKFLIEMDNFFAPGTFARRGTSFDKLKDIPEGQSTWKIEDIAIDAVFSQLFLLPNATHKLVYYHSVITEACKLAPGAIAPTLGRAIRFLYRYIDTMDLELAYRFLDWFSHHLSNFDFRWKWSEWTGEVDSTDTDPKHAFITGAIDKEIRLSFPKRILETLPPDYHKLISQGKLQDTPQFKFKDDTTPYAPEGQQILAMLKKKVPEDEIQTVIEAIEKQATEHGIADPLVTSTDVYMTAVCFIGSKSLSHVLSCIDRCKERLLAAGAKSEQARRQIIQSVVEYWKDLPGTAVNIVDKLLNFTIVTPDSVIHWCLGQPSLGVGTPLSDSWRFEMVAATMGKITNRMRQIVAARVQAIGFEGNEEQVALLDETIAKERESMRALFTLIQELLSVYASGAADSFIEGADGVADQDLDFIKAWALRWIEVFRRKAAVEETVVGEAAVETTLANGKIAFKRAEIKRKQEEEEREKRRAEAEERRVKLEQEEEEKRKLENGQAQQQNGANDVLDEADADN